MFLVFLNFAVFAWVGYSETEMGNREFNNVDYMKVIFLPILFILVVVCTNGYTKVIFDIDAHGKYHMEDLFQAQMGIYVLYTGITGIRMLGKAMYESDPTRKSQMLQMGSFPMSFLLSWLLKILIGDEFPVICVFVTLWLLFVFVGSTSEQVSTDKLTQIHNRQNLLTYINMKIRTHEDRLFLIMMDIDYFKRINDTYGHQEGDQALIRTANALKSAAQSMTRRPYLARYGGDVAVGAMTVITSVSQLASMPVSGVCQGGQPVMSFNFGAGKKERVKEAFRFQLLVCFGYTAIFWVLMMLVPGVVAGIFTSDATLIQYTTWAMRIYMAGIFSLGIQIACQQSFMALGQAKVSLLLACLRKLILLIPLIFILPHVVADPVFGVFLAEPVSDIIAATVTAATFFSRFDKILDRGAGKV